MATDFDRDDRLHGLLRDTLRSQPASGPCIDAATLAAWAEEALTPEETAAADAHLATCARCRELATTLAATMEAEGAPAATVVQFASRPNGRWKVIVGAMGAIAASALIWVAVRDGSPSSTLDTTSAANRPEQSREMGGSVPLPATSAPLALPAESANALQPRSSVTPEAERRLGQQGQQALSVPRAESKLARENTARAAEPPPVPVEPPARLATPLPQAAPPPPPPPAIMPPPAAPPAATAAAAGAARSSTITGLPQTTSSITADTVKPADPNRASEAFFTSGPVIAEFVAGADLQLAQGQGFGTAGDLSRASGAGRGGGGGGGRGGAGASGGIAQKTTGALVPEPVRWRLRGASTAAVERSNDGGTTWLPVPIPVTPLLAGGSAPTNTVCWLAGRAGTVLLSTDGTTFRQVTKPADADLVSVRATDARSATVRTADGREFSTADGGITWIRKPPTNKP